MTAWEKFNPGSKESPFKKVSDTEIKAAATSATPEGQKRREVAKGEKPLEGASDTEINLAVEGMEKGHRQVKMEKAGIGASAEDIQAAVDKLNEAYGGEKNPLDELAAKTDVEAKKKQAPQQEARP